MRISSCARIRKLWRRIQRRRKVHPRPERLISIFARRFIIWATLKARGLLGQTLVVWGGEFGRTPCAQFADGGYTKAVGRDHNPFGFTMWMAGGGVKGGTVYGATDEYGYFAVENKVHLHDLHATMLHLLGLDHRRLTYPFSGRDMRLTDVAGEVIPGLLA